jgi:large subunit ribosomal protein L5
MNRLKEKYKSQVIPALSKHFGYKNPHQVPKMVKIVVSMGVGSATQNKANLDNAVKDLEQITGRKVLVTKARKSISNFKLRQGMPIGCKVTLRDEVMYEFFVRLISIAIPRLRLSWNQIDSFDGRGKPSFGSKKRLFPEIEFDKVGCRSRNERDHVTTLITRRVPSAPARTRHAVPMSV